jgi:hypothetical protein
MIAEGVGVFVAVAVAVLVDVLVGVLVDVRVGVDVAVAVFVGVPLGVPIGPKGRGHAYAPRPRVQSESVVLPRSIVMSQIITAGSPLLNRVHTGVAAVMSFVKYKPKSVPAKTCCGKLGLTMIESTGMFGKLPVLFCQVNDPQRAAQLT